MRTRNLPVWQVNTWNWWVQRNPHYLLSAVAMAWAVRAALVSEDVRAGDVGHILRSLLSLQAYEIGLIAVLIVLFRARRGLEDQRSLRIVAAVFWTGPLTVTTELAARDALLGSASALAAGVVALALLALVRRLTAIRAAAFSWILAGTVVALLVALPGALARCDAGTGLRETLLYATWLLTAALIAVAGAARVAGVGASGWWELAWRGVLLVGLGVQLWGMNYAFFARGAAFFAAPCVAALVFVALGPVLRDVLSRPARIAAALGLPLLALCGALPVCAPDASREWLPAVLRDPMHVGLVAAAAVWAFSALQLRARAFIHLSVAAGALLCWSLRLAPGAAGAASPADLLGVSGVGLGLYVCGAYLLASGWILRAGCEALLGFALVSIAALQQQPELVRFLVFIGLGWGVWAFLWRFGLAGGMWASVAVVTLLASAFEAAEDVRALARAHSIAAPVGLALVGWAFQRQAMAAAGVAAGGTTLGFHALRWVASGAAPVGLPATVLAYVLLAAGMSVSWFKPRLLRAGECADRDGARAGDARAPDNLTPEPDARTPGEI